MNQTTPFCNTGCTVLCAGVRPVHPVLLQKGVVYRKGSNYSAKKNNSRRGLALELERKKSASIRVAPYINCTLEP